MPNLTFKQNFCFFLFLGTGLQTQDLVNARQQFFKLRLVWNSETHLPLSLKCHVPSHPVHWFYIYMRFYFFPFVYFYFMCVSVLPVCMLVHYVHAVPSEVRIWDRTSGNWSWRWLWGNMWVLGTEPMSSGRTARSLNCWATCVLVFFCLSVSHTNTHTHWRLLKEQVHLKEKFWACEIKMSWQLSVWTFDKNSVMQGGWRLTLYDFGCHWYMVGGLRWSREECV